MLGPPKSRDLDRSVVVSLEQLVPADHFYRHLERELDLSFVRDWVVDLYAPAGRPSIDPVVFFKLELALFFQGLRSERQLMRVAADHLSIRSGGSGSSRSLQKRNSGMAWIDSGCGYSGESISGHC